MADRRLKTHVKNKKLSKSSAAWMHRQLNDPYVAKAHEMGYRGRAAFKIIELNQQFHFFKKGQRVVDLGAAPGGWSQVAVKEVGSTKEKPMVFGIDLLPINPLDGAEFIQMDFLDEQAPDRLKEMMNGEADIVMSDMAANATGTPAIDHLRIINLVEAGYLFATQVLKKGGWYIAKVFQGGTEGSLLAEIKKDFEVVKHVKPNASRKESSEFYLVAKGFKFRNKDE
ncbi:MAG: RlmE family RNA methyltransferase [Alphaproteobacteria bacterium]|nr:RlmE family RNA methyltransferase [Alphaproteobacteria bacterium]